MKVLFVCDYWGTGGIERFVTNAAAGLTERGHSCSVFCCVDSGKSLFDEELTKYKISKICACVQGRAGANVSMYRSGIKLLARLLGDSHYDVVHVNAMNSVSLLFDWVASNERIPVRAAHSHNSALGAGTYSPKRIVHKAGKRLLVKYPNLRVACSYSAGEHLFGDAPFLLLRNGIDTTKFAFDPQRRAEIRSELGVDEATHLIGNIGRLSTAKNPIFHVKVAEELSKRTNHKFAYLVAGEGEYDDQMRREIRDRDLEDVFILLPSVRNPESYYSALDVFVMPSLFEGLPITLTEAQCSGLPVIASDAISSECSITDLVHFLPLESGAVSWANYLEEMLSSFRTKSRNRYEEVVKQSEYSIVSMCKSLENIYLETK